MRIKIIGEETIVEYDEGTGDNLTDEDIEAGYVDYIYYTIYDVADLANVEEVDGGMILLEHPYKEEFGELFDYGNGDKRLWVDEDKVAKRVLDFIGYVSCDWMFV